MATAAHPHPPLPSAIRRTLSDIDRRLRVSSSLRGAGRMLLILSLGLVPCLLLDLFVVLPGWLRVALWAAWMAAGLVLLLLGVGKPLARRREWSHLASYFEADRPEACERVTSAVGLLRRDAAAHGSPELIQALVAQAEAYTQSAQGAALPLRRGAAWPALGVCAVGTIALATFAWPDPVAQLIRRFFMPWSATARVATCIIDVEPGDATTMTGSDLGVRVRVRRRFTFGGPLPQSAALLWTGPDRTTHRLPMLVQEGSSDTRREFLGTLRGVPASLTYKAHSGDELSREYRLTVLDPPGAKNLIARVEPPTYTRRPPQSYDDPGTLAVFEHSRVSVSISPNRPLRSVGVAWATQPHADESPSLKALVAKPAADGPGWQVEFEPSDSGVYQITYEDFNGLKHTDPSRSIALVRDLPPELSLEGTDDAHDSRPDDLLVVGVAARDDVAVAGADIAYQIERIAERGARSQHPADSGQLPVALEGFGTPEAQGQASLNLKKMGLRPGDELVYEIVVQDNRPDPGPNVTRSQPRRLRIRDNAEPLSQRLARSQSEALRARLERLRKSAAETHQAAVGLRYAADAAERGNGQWGREQAESLKSQTDNARQTVEELAALARDFADSAQFESLAQPTRQLSDVEANGARQMLDRASDAADTRQRLADLRLADTRLDAVKSRLEQLQRLFDQLSRQADDLQQLGALAEREDDLSRRAVKAEEGGAPQGELEAMRQEQEALRHQVDDLVRRSPELRSEVMRRQADQAERVAQQARELAERQRQEERKTTDDRTRSDRLAALAIEQQAIALEARKLALDVDTPLMENGRARVNADVVSRPVDALKRGDTEPAMQQIEEAAGELRRLAREIDEVRMDPKTAARRLVRRQEALSQQTAVVLQHANTPAGRTAVAEKLKPLQQQQAEIARQAEALAPGVKERAILDAAHGALRNAAETLKTDNPELVRQRQNEAREGLTRLADSLPEVWQRRQAQQQALNEARNHLDAVMHEFEQHVRDTSNQAAASKDPVTASRELARRIEPLVQRQREAAQRLQSIESTGETRSQHNLALHQAQLLAEQLQTLAKSAPPESDLPSVSAPRRDWHMLGTFDIAAAPPFLLDRMPDFEGTSKDRQGRSMSWKPVAAGDQGIVDLHGVFGSGAESVNASAFAVAEITSESSGPARLSVGSDDTLTIWHNGEVIYDFQGRRSFSANQESVTATLVAGLNRFVVRCGNGDGDWKFSFAITQSPPREASERLATFEEQRERLATGMERERTLAERLQQAIDGREPADRRAAELAQQIRDVAKAAAETDNTARDVGADLERIRAGVAALDAPDAAEAKSNVIRKVDELRSRLSKNPRKKTSLSEAAAAVDALARSLGNPDTEAATPQASDASLINDDAELGLGREQRVRARELRRRQRELADALRAILAEGTNSQQLVRAEASEVASALEALRDEVNQLSQSGRAQGAAQQAFDTLRHKAVPAMERGAAELAQGRLASGRDAQRQAADAAEQAARHANDLAEALRADAPQTEQAGNQLSQPTDAGGAPRPNLQTARAAQAQAAGELAKAAAQGISAQAKAATQSAANEMHSAAQGLRAAAGRGRSAGKQLSRAGDADFSPNPNPNGVGRAVGLHLGDLDPPQLARQRRRWGELPGHLREEMNQVDPSHFRSEYARLIQLYFREIADTDTKPSESASPQGIQPR